MYNRKSFLDKIERFHLSGEEKKKVFRFIEDNLFAFFIKDFYESEQELQQDFIQFQSNKGFLPLFESVLEDLYDETGISLSTGDFERLTASRVKLCSVCNQPFLSFDSFNKMKICYKKDYIKYKMNVENKEFFKMSLKYSECFLNYKKNRANDRYSLSKEKKALIVER